MYKSAPHGGDIPDLHSVIHPVAAARADAIGAVATTPLAGNQCGIGERDQIDQSGNVTKPS